MLMTGVVRVCSAPIEISLASPDKNAAKIISAIKEAKKNESSVILFSELALTGYSCADLFYQNALIERAEQRLLSVVKHTEGIIAVVGAPLRSEGALFDAAFVIADKKIVCAAIKRAVPTSGAYLYERAFCSLENDSVTTARLGGFEFPIANKLKISTDKISFSVIFGDSVYNGDCFDILNNETDLLLIPTALQKGVGSEKKLSDALSYITSAIPSAALLTSSGKGESVKDSLFSSLALSYECADELIKSDSLSFADIDTDKIRALRKMRSKRSIKKCDLNTVFLDFDIKESDGEYISVRKYPFIPKNDCEIRERCLEILDIQKRALAQRLSLTGGKLVIGVSGGLDSTLALIAAAKSIDLLSLDRKNVIGVTMPSFGTSNATKSNALKLMEGLGISVNTVDIGRSVLLHLEDIGLDENDRSATYENAQARERTQVLMDLAGKNGAIVLGTGDLSELALGWCTYNGYNMSMYGINADIPKTLIKKMIITLAHEKEFENIKEVLLDIAATPISPELLPPDSDGKIAQKTEDLIGPYALTDFFIYYTVKYGYSPTKTFSLATKAFEDEYDRETVKKWLVSFYKRFFFSAFKRDALPDGVRIGSISLSPRGDFMMPSDAMSELFVSEAENL